MLQSTSKQKLKEFTLKAWTAIYTLYAPQNESKTETQGI